MNAKVAVVSVVGAGVISHSYLGAISRSPILRLKAIASRTMVTAQEQASRYGCEAMTTESLLADPEIDIVVNLAPPQARTGINRMVLAAGKHLYTEKPFAQSMTDANDLLELAETKGLKIGCAPDTFFGQAHQDSRKAIDEGRIGRVVAGAAVMASHGMELWHPRPHDFYRSGAGPVLDIGPYVITQLVHLLGPAKQVSALGSNTSGSRSDRQGRNIAIEVDTTINGAILFADGANVAITLSWDVWKRRSQIELHGTSGGMMNPDPSRFTGEVLVSDGRQASFRTLSGGPETVQPPMPDADALRRAIDMMAEGRNPHTGLEIGPDTPVMLGDERGLGLVDLAEAIRDDREPRASGSLATHVLEILLGLLASARDGTTQILETSVPRPRPLEQGVLYPG